MRRFALLCLPLICLSAPSYAAPKTITLENCAKVETEITHLVANNGDRYVLTVHCIGDDQDEPKVSPTTTFNMGNGINLVW